MIVCDRCREEILGGSPTMQFTAAATIPGHDPDFRHRISRHLCEPCRKLFWPEFMDFFVDFLATTKTTFLPESQPAIPPKDSCCERAT